MKKLLVALSMIVGCGIVFGCASTKSMEANKQRAEPSALGGDTLGGGPAVFPKPTSGRIVSRPGKNGYPEYQNPADGKWYQ